jgi:hypothetical protein
MALIRQSRPDSGFSFQVNVLDRLKYHERQRCGRTFQKSRSTLRWGCIRATCSTPASSDRSRDSRLTKGPSVQKVVLRKITESCFTKTESCFTKREDGGYPRALLFSHRPWREAAARPPLACVVRESLCVYEGERVCVCVRERVCVCVCERDNLGA